LKLNSISKWPAEVGTGAFDMRIIGRFLFKLTIRYTLGIEMMKKIYPG